MKRTPRILCLLFALAMVPALSGCVYMVIGGVGALGGYYVSPDTVEGILTDKQQDDIWDASVDVLSIMGIITERSEPGGVIMAKVQGAKVTINITQISQSSVKISVKARRAFFPKIRLAQDIYVKIVDNVNQ
ncbi:MAG: hypothetical protein Q8Q08_06755 [Candidatus Omnitrophota bacterium]|nr:hypothetical protein [Candidatus Omnitrophota bacterium]MDZ4241642.1 hypothetical protein [Candidatus Omnitrophota bacterium]